MQRAILKFSSLKKSFGGIHLYENLNFSIKRGKTTVILGPSGCGKSTLLNMIASLTQGYSGRIDKNFAKLSYIFQEDRLITSKTVLENLRICADKVDKEILDILDLSKILHQKVQTLSGGQSQRVAIARAFVVNPDIILMDEPFGSLDIYLKNSVIKKLNLLLNRRKISTLLVTHNVAEALLLADEIIIFSDIPVTILAKISIPPIQRRLSSSKLMEYQKKVLSVILDGKTGEF